MAKRLLLGTNLKFYLVEVTNFFDLEEFHFINLLNSDEGWVIGGNMYAVPERHMARDSNKIARMVTILSDNQEELAGTNMHEILGRFAERVSNG